MSFRFFYNLVLANYAQFFPMELYITIMEFYVIVTAMAVLSGGGSSRLILLSAVLRKRELYFPSGLYVSLKTLLQQGISEPEFYGDLMYRFRKIMGNLTFRSNSKN